MRFRRRKAETEKAEQALESAKDNLRQVKKRGTEVSAVSNALREVRERNHFAEQLEEIIVRQKGSFG